MRIVVDIDEETLQDLYDSRYVSSHIKDVFRSATPLPKIGYGRLIAEPTEEDIAKTVGGQSDFAECIREAVKAVFNNAPAIIEADKEE